MIEELPPGLRVLLRAEARRRNVEPEALLAEILSGKNPLPQHLSDLVREVWRASHVWVSGQSSTAS
jgi:predicted Ser/Thr protein kinase